jgi:predicted PurR-regulated permease PerM
MQVDPAASAEPSGNTSAAEPEPTSLPTHINIRSVSLALIAMLACAYALHWASAVFIPLLLGVMTSYALSPLVDRLCRWRLPRALGAAVVLVTAVGGFGSLVYSVSDDAAAMLESLPVAADKLRDALRPSRGAPVGTIEKVQQAAAKLEQAAEESGAVAPVARGVTRVQIERPRLNIKDYLWSSTMGLASLLVQAAVVFFIAFFLLTSGDSFRRKLVRLTGPTFAKRRITVQVLDEITAQIQRYLMIQVFTSTLVGVATWAALSWLGLERAAVWGLVAGLLNLVPYLGAIVTAGGLALVAFLQFGTFGMAALVGGVSMFINTLEGNLLTPWLTGRASSMNPVVIFVGVLAFGWLWGIWGLLLGTPLIMVAKSVCDRVDDLKPIGELLGE